MFLSDACTVLYYTHLYHFISQLLSSGFWPTCNFCSYLSSVLLPNFQLQNLHLLAGGLSLAAWACIAYPHSELQSVGRNVMLTREQPSTNGSWKLRCKGGKTQVCSMQFPSTIKAWLPLVTDLIMNPFVTASPPSISHSVDASWYYSQMSYSPCLGFWFCENSNQNTCHSYSDAHCLQGVERSNSTSFDKGLFS